MKKKKILKILLILILIFLFIKMIFFKSLSNSKTIEDFLFFKVLGDNLKVSEDIIDVEEKEYRLNVNYKNIDFRNINLSETINRETLIYEKIAPGTKGSFNIILEANKNSKYKVVFNSINKKPQNLKFKANINNKEIGKANTLEELQKYLIGYIRKDEKIDIRVNWYWEFEDNEENDKQDTKDAQYIKKYQFDINAIGEEIT
ncbi:MAG: hypothetical protein HFJ60_00480 [Clostridia bacterium]|jgi:flagellar biogenesis protein FliO|nr:hypothetical protein [Clostridia bacterium]